MTQPARTGPLSRTQGIVASLHLHPAESGEPLLGAEMFRLIEHQGIEGNPRYFGRVSRLTRQPSRLPRQPH